MSENRLQNRLSGIPELPPEPSVPRNRISFESSTTHQNAIHILFGGGQLNGDGGNVFDASTNVPATVLHTRMQKVHQDTQPWSHKDEMAFLENLELDASIAQYIQLISLGIFEDLKKRSALHPNRAMRSAMQRDIKILETAGLNQDVTMYYIQEIIKAYLDGRYRANDEASACFCIQTSDEAADKNQRIRFAESFMADVGIQPE